MSNHNMNHIPQIQCPEFSSIPHIKHAFLTRNGGVSKGLYASLNCGPGSNDDGQHVQENRMRALQSVSGKGELVTLHQIHSNKVAYIKERPKKPIEADAMVTDQGNIVLGILTADCTPVLFADAKQSIIGAAHAGWKGAWSGILENTVDQMVALGANKQDISAVIGPTIAQRSYEVGPEFYQRFIEQDAQNTSFFIASTKAHHHMFDLPGYVTSHLQRLSLRSITNVEQDTCAKDQQFFSYRRSCLRHEADYGRNISLVTMS
jgi:YfiH family protein